MAEDAKKPDSDAKEAEAKPAEKTGSVPNTAADRASESGEKKPAKAPEKPAMPKKSGGLKVKLYAYGILIIALALGAGYITYPLWRGDADQKLADLGLPLKTPDLPTVPFIADMAKPEAPPQPAEPTEPAGPTLEDRIADLQAEAANLKNEFSGLSAKVDGLGGPIDTSAFDSKVDALAEQSNARIAEIEKTIEGVSGEIVLLREGLASSGDGSAGDQAGMAQLAARNADLASQISDLTDKIAALESTPAAPTVSPEQLSALEAENTALKEALSTTNQQVVALLDEVQSLRADLAARPVADNSAASFSLAVNQMAALAAGSGEFEGALETVAGLAGADEKSRSAIDALKSVSATGAKTLAQLKSGFAAAATAAIQADAVGKDEGFVGKTLNSIAALVTVRKIDGVEGDGLDAKLARAELALTSNDLPTAVGEIEAIDGAAGDALASWLGQAQARVQVNNAISELQGIAISRIASKG